MAIEICLCIQDTGEMYVETGEKETAPEEAQEGGNRMPVKSIDEALQMISQMAEEASLAPPQEETAEEPLPEEQVAPSAQEDEEAAMAQSFRGR